MSRFLNSIVAVLILAPLAPARSQQPAPAVGVVKAERKPITETSEFVGRIQAIERVDLSARVTAFLDERLFKEGKEVKKGDLLYRLEQAPFQADMQAKQAAIKQVEAQLKNANLTLARAQQLLTTSAGTVATVDNAEASQQSQTGQLLAAQAQLRQSEINLAYTEIRAPIDGKIGHTSVTPGNVVGPGSGVLATIVGQDPMYVVFSIPVRAALDVRRRIASDRNLSSLRVRIRLPDGTLYGEAGNLDFLNNSVTGNTDTLMLRATIPNPVGSGEQTAAGADRELVDGEFVTVLLEGTKPIEVLTIPRASVLSDQSGDYVYVVDAQSKAQRQNIKLGQSTPTMAVILSGLQEGQTVIVDGLQRVRPDQPVAPGPAAKLVPTDRGAVGGSDAKDTDSKSASNSSSADGPKQ